MLSHSLGHVQYTSNMVQWLSMTSLHCMYWVSSSDNCKAFFFQVAALWRDVWGICFYICLQTLYCNKPGLGPKR